MIEIDLKKLIDDSIKWQLELKRDEISEATIRNYNNAINKFFDFLKDNIITEVNKDSVIAYKNYLLEQKKAGVIKISTLNQWLTYLNKFLADNGLYELRVKTEKVQRKTTLNDMITESDYNRLIRWADKLGMEREKLIIQTLSSCGIRISELESFSVENLNNSNTLEIRNKGKTRTIQIPKKLKTMLLEYAQRNNINKGVIFHGRSTDKLLDKTQIWRNLKYIAGRARVKKSKVHAHSFRHLYSKRYIKEGGDILDLADYLGHESLDSTRIYSQKTAEEQQKEQDRLADIYL